MDECEPVEKKVELIVPAVSDVTTPISESLPTLMEAAELPNDNASESIFPPGDISPLQWHMSAARMMPLPASVIEGASFHHALNRPLPIIGQLLSIFLMISGLAYLWAHHMLGSGSAYSYLLLPGVLPLLFIIPLFASIRFQARMLSELIGGAIYPLKFFQKESVFNLSVSAIGDALQGSNNYLLAAVCYGEIVRRLHPLDVFSNNRCFERELIISLAYSGQFKQSQFYADSAVRYTEYLLATLGNKSAFNYFAFAARTAGLAYEIAGDAEMSRKLREKCYESTKTHPLSNESRLFGILAKAEACVMAEDFESAKPLLQQFVENIYSGHQMSKEPAVKSRSHHLLAICYAHSGEFAEAHRLNIKGFAEGAGDLATYVVAEGVWAEAQILKLSGKVEEADAVISKALQKLKLPSGSVLWRRLTSLQKDPPPMVSSDVENHDELPEHEEKPLPPPVLFDEANLLNTIKRYTFGFVLIAITGYFLYSQKISFALLCILPLIYAFYSYRTKENLIAAGASAISKGTPLLIKVQAWGFKNLYVYRDDGKRESYIATSAEQWAKLTSITANMPFEAVAYEDEIGRIAAVQVLGQFASVKRAKKDT